MICYFDDNESAVQFVEDLQKSFPESSASITTITPEKYAVCFAPTVIDTSSEDIERLRAFGFFETQANT